MAEKEIEPLTEEELTTPIEKLIARKAEELYRKETGKEWKDEPPEEKEAEEYVRKAGKQILNKWFKASQEWLHVTETVFGAPPERKMLLLKVGRKIRLIPTEEIAKPEKIPAKAVLQCPKCGAIAMTPLVRGIWQCQTCRYTLNTLTWFPKR